MIKNPRKVKAEQGGKAILKFAIMGGKPLDATKVSIVKMLPGGFETESRFEFKIAELDSEDIEGRFDHVLVGKAAIGNVTCADQGKYHEPTESANTAP